MSNKIKIKAKRSPGVVSLFLLLAVFLVVGEILCIVRFIRSDFESSYKREIIYGISMVTGAGGIIGWIPIEDTPQEDK